jgi:hypothetical protein
MRGQEDEAALARPRMPRIERSRHVVGGGDLAIRALQGRIRGEAIDRRHIPRRENLAILSTALSKTGALSSPAAASARHWICWTGPLDGIVVALDVVSLGVP